MTISPGAVRIFDPETGDYLTIVDGKLIVDNSTVLQPVSGPLTDDELRAAPVDVSGPLTDAQLRADPVEVSIGGGSLAVTGPLTDAELRASAVPVSGTFFQATQPVSAASLPLPTGAATEATLAAASAKLPATLGQKTMANSLAVVMASDQAGIPVSATIGASENHLGEIGGRTRQVNASVTRPNDTNAYASGDAITDSTSAPTAITFSNCARVADGSGVILGAKLIDSANQSGKGSFELWVFESSPTPDNDNAVFTPTDAECETVAAIFRFTTADYSVGDATSGAGGNVVYESRDVNKPFKCSGGGTSLYGLIKAAEAYTPVAQEKFTFRLSISQD